MAYCVILSEKGTKLDTEYTFNSISLLNIVPSCLWPLLLFLQKNSFCCFYLRNVFIELIGIYGIYCES